MTNVNVTATQLLPLGGADNAKRKLADTFNIESNCHKLTDIFKKGLYPENRHIKDKIRQILQQLRDLGLVRHISENRWQRINGGK